MAAIIHWGRWNFNVDEADGVSRSDRLAILRTWRPDVALVDVGLPGLDGYGFARAVAVDPKIGMTPLVAVMGYGNQKTGARRPRRDFEFIWSNQYFWRHFVAHSCPLLPRMAGKIPRNGQSKE